MILSASRRTDIPNYYSDWFFNRIRAGFVCVRNPMNPRQVSRIALNSEVVDCIVFWTKNPEPMLERLEELGDYAYYFQFTLTGYGGDIERGVPHKRERMIPIFRRLSEKIGSRRVIWRYDPIFFTARYSPSYHLKAFGQIAEALKGYTDKCVISFVDSYAKNRKALAGLGAYELEAPSMLDFAAQLGRMAGESGMSIGSCAEAIDLTQCGIAHNSCIDKRTVEEIIGCGIDVGKDRNQRPECGCVESVEIGTYDTCKNGCLYCYANSSRSNVLLACGRYDPDSPLLCGRITEEDKVSERKVRSVRT